MFTKYIYLARLGLIDSELMSLAWNLKRSKKTYLGYKQLWSLANNYLVVKKRRQAPPQVAEFGVGRGGSAAVMSWMVGHYGGSITLYDIFGRIPEPTEKDGDRAQERYRVILNEESEGYYGNIPNLLEVILADLNLVCRLDQIQVVPGRYEDTLCNLKEERAFDLVHIDCDWYESSKAVLNYLQHNLSPGAILQVDDYSNWQGSHMATSEAEWLKPYKSWLVEGALVIDTGIEASP